MTDPKYLGIPNICFSLTDKDDKREKKFIKQRLQRGFDDTETWSLRDTIANFVVPRLERYNELCPGCPMGMTFEEWNQILKKILWSFKFVQGIDQMDRTPTQAEWKEYQRGMKLFAKHFIELWW